MKKFWKWKIRSRVISVLLMLLIPPAAVCCMEYYTHVPQDLTVPIYLLNLGFYYLIYLFCSALLGRIGRGYRLASILFMLFGLTNYCVVSFRSSPIVPWDIYSIRTAFSVAGNYTLEITPKLVLVILGFLALAYLGGKIGGFDPDDEMAGQQDNGKAKQKGKGKTAAHTAKNDLKTSGKQQSGSKMSDREAKGSKGEKTSGEAAAQRKRRHPVLRLISIFVLALAVFGYGKAVGTDEVIDYVGLDTTLFTPNVLYRNNGLIGGFLENMRYLRVEKPDGYSAEKAEEIEENYETEETEADLTELPNIIVIMNEAFSDLSVYGDFNVDQDYMPFIHSLEGEALMGTCYVSVKGGNTANSEYEFLTGDSMAFMPTGSVPYQQYLKQEMPSLASRLASLGYETTAIHPYNSTGWCRNTVYPLLGFQNMLFRTDFTNPVKIRNYVSDQSAFEKIIELYEEKDEDSRIFTFEVTMQNHGGYSKDVEGFTESVHLTDLENKTTSVRAAEKYLTLIKETDAAFEELVSYFREQEEPTIILMFGDHQPSDYVTNTILKVLGLEREGSDEIYFDSYRVPYIMWANYDLGDTDSAPESISLNYLGGLLMEKAGIGLTGYQQFLKELQEEYPALTANMVMTADGTRVRTDEISSDLIDEYHTLVYNHLCDSDDRNDTFFDGTTEGDSAQ